MQAKKIQEPLKKDIEGPFGNDRTAQTCQLKDISRPTRATCRNVAGSIVAYNVEATLWFGRSYS